MGAESKEKLSHFFFYQKTLITAAEQETRRSNVDDPGQGRQFSQNGREREPSQNKYGGGHKRNGNNLEIYVTEENKKESMECEEFV